MSEGRVLSGTVESTFDNFFREVGDGSVDCDYLLGRGCVLLQEATADS